MHRTISIAINQVAAGIGHGRHMATTMIEDAARYPGVQALAMLN
jgi:hypothetical protein